MKTDIYQTVTTAIIDQLEAGTRPWVKPWHTGNTARPLRANGEAYRGINVILLWMAGEAKGYAAPTWMTYKQAADLKAQVRKGEKASTVTYADKLTKDEGTDDERDIFFVKRYPVFNIEQIDGLPERFYATTTTQSLDPEQRIEGAEAYTKRSASTWRDISSQSCPTTSTALTGPKCWKPSRKPSRPQRLVS